MEHLHSVVRVIAHGRKIYQPGMLQYLFQSDSEADCFLPVYGALHDLSQRLHGGIYALGHIIDKWMETNGKE